MFYVGIDIGSTASKLWIFKEETVFYKAVYPTGWSSGKRREDIAFGVIESITSKVKSLCQKHSDSINYFLTGGLSNNKYIVERLKEKLGAEVTTDELGRYAGAIGAAISAKNIK